MARESPNDLTEAADRAQRCITVPCRPTERGVGEQRTCGGTRAGRRRVVRGIARAAYQPFGVVASVIEPARPIRETVQHHLEQSAGRVVPAAVAGHGVEREQSFGDIAVVFEYAEAVADLAVT